MTTPVNNSGSTTPPAASKTNYNLGKDDFLKLLTTQLENQDPLNPQDEQAMIGTLAQFSSLEQMTNINSTLTQTAAGQQWSQAVNVLHHTVQGTTADGKSFDGLVDSVQVVDGSPVLMVNGEPIKPSWVKSVL